MALKEKGPVARKSLSNSDFEVLLRRASECLTVRRLHVVKTNRSSDKTPSPASGIS
jgi:hypothetical protein